MKTFITIASIFMLALSMGCAGGRAIISAESIERPVSLSAALFDNNGQIIIPSDTTIVGHFSFSLKNWTILWTLIPLSGHSIDISKKLEREISSRSGDAIINLTVKGTESPFWPFSSLIPILPSSVNIVIEGDVVKYNQFENYVKE